MNKPAIVLLSLALTACTHHDHRVVANAYGMVDGVVVRKVIAQDGCVCTLTEEEAKLEACEWRRER